MGRLDGIICISVPGKYVCIHCMFTRNRYEHVSCLKTGITKLVVMVKKKGNVRCGCLSTLIAHMYSCVQGVDTWDDTDHHFSSFFPSFTISLHTCML